MFSYLCNKIEFSISTVRILAHVVHGTFWHDATALSSSRTPENLLELIDIETCHQSNSKVTQKRSYYGLYITRRAVGDMACTCASVMVQGVGSPNGEVAEEAEAVAAVGVVHACHHPCGPRVVARRPHRAERIAVLQSSTANASVQLNFPRPAHLDRDNHCNQEATGCHSLKLLNTQYSIRTKLFSEQHCNLQTVDLRQHAAR